MMIEPLIVDPNNITNDEKEKLWDFVGVYSDEEIVDCSINEGFQRCNNHKLQVKNSLSYYAQQYNDLERKFRKQTVDAFEKLLGKNKNRVKKGTWSNLRNHKIYADWLYIKLGCETMDDLYNITGKIMSENYGCGLMTSQYNWSCVCFLNKVYPEIEWLPWKFIQAPRNYWNDIENQKIYMEWLFGILDCKTIEDRYKITGQDLLHNYGSSLLRNQYNNRVQRMISTIYPEIEWLPWKFRLSPMNYWNDIKNHKQYMEWLFGILDYKTIEDRYKITADIINKNYGGGLLSNQYNSSLQRMITTIYPEIEWLPWKFIQVPANYWNNIENHKKYMEWLFDILGYKTIEDWYKITRDIIHKNHGGGLFSNQYNSSISKMITTIYPEYKWDVSKFKKSYSIGQIEWLNYLCVNTPDITHMINNDEGEFNIPNSNYKADGYSKINNTIYEYHGDFWHGNPKIYNPDDINSITKTTYKELYDKTMQKQYFCEDNHYKYVSIWESEWLRGKIALIKIQRKYKTSQN
jgi:hypothetical protein